MAIPEFNEQLVNLESSLEKFAYRFSLAKADAKDLVQETILRVLKNKHKYVNNVNFKAWAFIIMKNIFINNYRRGKRQNTFIDRSNESLVINRVKSAHDDEPDNAYSALEITQLIGQLKDMYRIPFEMLISGYKYKEIADKLNLNVGTIKSRIFLTRKQLMDQLNETQTTPVKAVPDI